MSQKFPFINITQVGASSASAGSSKPLLTVKPNSQLLKPGVGGASKAQVNIAGAGGAGGKVNIAKTKAVNTAAANTGAKNKLAIFKAQVFDGF